ncbi:MAG: type II toxin-antitoxin system Phd/YefM family antitoxin [Gammaproteobacteria bacterium]|nr:type II toxin-antitoxin system Phd/YefM family antitoxin [Gammaproteobacteria bacterium]
MSSVNMLQAKTTLSRLVDAIERGEEQEIIIARNGRPAARLVKVEASTNQQRLGIAKGQFVVPDSIDDHNAEVAALFQGRDQP